MRGSCYQLGDRVRTEQRRCGFWCRTLLAQRAATQVLNVAPAGTPRDDQAAWSGPHDLGDRACCWPAQPVVQVLIPPAPARRHSVDLLLLYGHHYRTSGAALAAAGAVIRTTGAGAEPSPPSMHQAIPFPPMPRHGDEPTDLFAGSCFWACR
jgi:hypothetical protein